MRWSRRSSREEEGNCSDHDVVVVVVVQFDDVVVVAAGGRTVLGVAVCMHHIEIRHHCSFRTVPKGPDSSYLTFRLALMAVMLPWEAD